MQHSCTHRIPQSVAQLSAQSALQQDFSSVPASLLQGCGVQASTTDRNTDSSGRRQPSCSGIIFHTSVCSKESRKEQKWKDPSTSNNAELMRFHISGKELQQ